MCESDVVVFLEQVKRCKTIIQNKLIEAEQWRDLALSITSVLNPDKVQSTGHTQRVAEAVERCIDIENEIGDCIDKLYEVEKEVVGQIQNLDPLDYDILHKVYVQDMSLKSVADTYDRSYSWATKRHTNAIEHLTKLMSAESIQNSSKLFQNT